MPIDVRRGLNGPLLLAMLAAVCGCAAPAAAPVAAVPAPPPPAPVVTQPPPAPPVHVVAPPPAPAPNPLDPVLAYADRVRALTPPELAQEVQRLSEQTYSPQRALQYAYALAQARQPALTLRAQTLLQRVLAQQDTEAQPFHALARLLMAQVNEQRRNEEVAERQAQQLRDAQRRIEQLNDRLEAVRAIERSVPAARGPASRPANP